LKQKGEKILFDLIKIIEKTDGKFKAYSEKEISFAHQDVFLFFF